MTSPVEKTQNSLIPGAYASIRTKYIGATDTRGSRISVLESRYGSESPRWIMVPYDHNYSIQKMHAVAAQLWVNKYLHKGTRVKDYGLTFNGNYYWTWESE